MTYEEKPRDQWIFEYPAQVVLAGTQIWWTTEVNIAFSRLEEGYENALKDYYKKQVTSKNFNFVWFIFQNFKKYSFFLITTGDPVEHTDHSAAW